MAIDPTLLGGLIFKVEANRVDIRDAIRDRLYSLQISDGAGFESDLLEVVLIDDDPTAPLEMPPTGAEIEVTMGYELFSRKMGLFVVDELELAGWPLALVVRARAAPFDKTKYGKTDLQTQKNRSWEKGSTLAKLLETLAKEHGMEPAISASMAGIVLPHLDQREESDINFLLRVVRKYDGVVKPAGGYLTITKRGEGLSASGAELPTVTLTRTDISDFRLTQQKRDTAGTVIAYYKVSKKAARTEIKVGNGEPVKRIGTNYPTKEMALAAAKAEYNRRLRGESKLGLTLIGSPEFMAEMIVNITDVHPAINGEWLVETCRHRLGDSGYMVDLELQKPNSGEEPDVSERELKAPKVGHKEEDDGDGPGGVITLPPLK